MCSNNLMIKINKVKKETEVTIFDFESEKCLDNLFEFESEKCLDNLFEFDFSDEYLVA